MKDYKKYLNQESDSGAKLIEILKNDGLVDKINKTQKKVSIKHYPNNYMNHVGYDDKQNKRYPLYYRIIFNKQSVKIKSNIIRAYSKEEFELEKLSTEDEKYIYREALALTYIVSDTFSKTIEETVYRHGIDKKVAEDGFDIKNLFDKFSIHNYELPKILEEKLLDMILNESEHETYKDEIINMFKYSNGLNPYTLLQFLKLKDKAKWEKFEGSFHQKIWLFNYYYYLFIQSHKEYEYIGVTAMDLIYCIDEQKVIKSYQPSPLSFESKFLNFYPNEEFSELIEQVKQIILS